MAIELKKEIGKQCKTTDWWMNEIHICLSV
jgi:hypothetical protein